MNILDFIKKHSKYNPTGHEDWENDWNSLLKNLKKIQMKNYGMISERKGFFQQ